MKKKVLLVGITAAMSIGLAGVVVAVSASNGVLESRASNAVAGSVVFSRTTGEFTDLGDNIASISGVTANGNTYYAVSRNISDISGTNYIAQFGTGRGGYENQYITFSNTKTDTSDFEFQGVTDIKVKTSANTTLYVYACNDGKSFSSSISVAGSTNPSKISLGASYKYVRLGVANAFSRNIVSVELYYTCGD